MRVPCFLGIAFVVPGSGITQNELDLGSGDTQKEPDLRSGDTQKELDLESRDTHKELDLNENMNEIFFLTTQKFMIMCV